MPHSLWPPLPCSRQAGRKNQYLSVIAGYCPREVWCQHRNWAPRGQGTRGVPRGTGKTSTGFSKGADLGIIRTPFLQLAHRSSGSAHSHTHAEEGIGRVQSLGFFMRGKRFSEPQQIS